MSESIDIEVLFRDSDEILIKLGRNIKVCLVESDARKLRDMITKILDEWEDNVDDNEGGK